MAKIYYYLYQLEKTRIDCVVHRACWMCRWHCLLPSLRSDQIRYWFIKSWQAQLNNT